jgi:hypothetical protein
MPLVTSIKIRMVRHEPLQDFLNSPVRTANLLQSPPQILQSPNRQAEHHQKVEQDPYLSFSLSAFQNSCSLVSGRTRKLVESRMLPKQNPCAISGIATPETFRPHSFQNHLFGYPINAEFHDAREAVAETLQILRTDPLLPI